MRSSLIVGTLLVGLFGCDGAVMELGPSRGGGSAQPSGSATPPYDFPTALPTPADECMGQLAPGTTVVRRLTRVEYDNTVRDLLGVDLHLAASFEPESKEFHFDNQSRIGAVSEILAEQYLVAAETLVKAANLASLSPCDLTRNDDACADQFIAAFGRRAYRRTLEPSEKAALKAVFVAGKATAGYTHGVQLVVEAALVAPQFLYRLEMAQPNESGQRVALKPTELATRLSYLLWGSMPDAQLLDAAESGGLSTGEQIEAQVARMLQDESRVRASLAHFAEQWLEVDALDRVPKNTTVYPDWSDAVKDALKAETRAFAADVMQRDSKAREMLVTDHTFVNQSLASLYGISGVTGTAMQRVALKSGERIGALTLGSILASQARDSASSPVKRGLFVREQMLCDQLPPAPDNVPAPSVDPNLTERERLAAHRANPGCAACHNILDPIGLGFEKYDGIGKFRSQQFGKPVDDSGDVTGTVDADGPFFGAVALSQRLADSREYSNCVVTQVFRYANGRNPAAAESCAVRQIQDAFAQGDGKWFGLLASLTKSEAFLYRLPATGVTP